MVTTDNLLYLHQGRIYDPGLRLPILIPDTAHVIIDNHFVQTSQCCKSDESYRVKITNQGFPNVLIRNKASNKVVRVVYANIE